MLFDFFSRNNKLNRVLIVIICLLVITLILYLGIQSNYEIQDLVQNQYSQEQLLFSKQMSIGMEEFLNQKTVNIEILAEHVSKTYPNSSLDEFKATYEKSKGFFAIQYINETGIVSYGYPENDDVVGYDLYKNHREYFFEKVKLEKITYVANPTFLFEGGLGVTTWTPVYDGDEFKGVILAIIHIHEISDRFLEKNDFGGNIYLIDKMGKVLYDSSGQYVIGKKFLASINETNPLLFQIYQKQMNGTEGTGFYYQNKNETNNTSTPFLGSNNLNLIAYSPIKWRNTLWSVAVTSPRSNVDKLIYSIYVKQGLFILVSGGFIFLVSFSIIFLLTRWNKSLEHEVDNKTLKLKESNKLLQNANTKLMELDKLKSDFVSMVSHELKTPLTAIKLSADLLINNYSDKKSIRMLELINKNVDRQTNIIDDLLDISQIENGRIKYRMELLDLHDLIYSTANSMKEQFEKKGMELKIDIPQNLAKIYADHDKLIQVFDNLLINALKFTPHGGIIEVRTYEYEKNIEIHIKDNGMGIPSDRIDKIFDKFYQIDSTSTRQFSGSGLGLAIVKAIIEGHGGTIRVESTYGEGSTFILTLNK